MDDASPVVRLPADFTTFYQQQFRPVLGLAFVLSGNRWTAEDLAQEAFLRAHREWSRVGHYDRPDAWVRKVVANLAVSRYRTMAARGRAMARLRGTAAQPVEPLAAEYEGFWREVRRLPKRQAQVVSLHYLEDRSVDDIAQILSIAPGTVKAQLHKARRTLEKRLASFLEDTK